MLGQLSSLRRRGQRLTQGFFLRGVATQKQVRRHKPAPAPPPDPPEKIEWWAVDGELVKAEKFDPKRVLAPLEHEHISNKRRRSELIRHLRRTRLNLKLHNQDSYWSAYMQRFQVLRDEWEKHVWDPPPVPQPKHRQPKWLAEETQKYVWQDPRREAFVASRNATQDPSGGAYTFDVSRMDQSAVRAKFDEKIGYKRQATSHSLHENRRNPGALGARPGMTPLNQRNVDFSRRKLRPTEFEEFDDVFKKEDDNEDTYQSHFHAKAMLSTSEDEDASKEALFNWSESDSEEDGGDNRKAAGEDDEDSIDDGAWGKVKARGKDEDDDEDEDSVDGESEVEDFQPRKKGWFGEEEDLFKDDE